MLSDSFDDLEKDLFVALRRFGWTIPQTEEEVEKAEKEIERNLVTLPGSLRDPSTLLDKLHNLPQPSVHESSVPDDATVEHLARAAREAGEITPEVEERMRQDRKAAEDKNQHGSKGTK